MKLTGQILKENREKKGISVNEVAMATKINAKAILAMESGDAAGLPPKTFLRGFVRAYAAYLGLDVAQIMTTYQEEMGSTKPMNDAPDGARTGGDTDGAASTRTTRRMDGPRSFEGKGSSTAKIGAIVIVILLIALIFLFKKKMDSYDSETVAATGTVLPVDPVTGALPSPIPSPNTAPTNAMTEPVSAGTTVAVSSPLPAAEGVTSGSVKAIPSLASPTATPLMSPIPTATAKSSPTPLPTSTPKITPTATPAPTPKATPTPAPSATPTPEATAPAPTATPTVTPVATPTVTAKPTPKPTPVGKPQEVLIEALDTVEVDAQIDGEPVKKMKLRGQEVQTIKAKKRVTLRFSDGGAVNLVVNGKDRGVPGDLGKPIRVELP